MTGETQRNESARITFVRTLEAPRSVVWAAWTKPEAIGAWWGPAGFSTRVEQHDFRPGGSWRYVMIGPDGTEYPSVGTFQEIVFEERLVTTNEFGEDFEAPPGERLPRGMTLTVLFEEVGNSTRLILHADHQSVEDRKKIEEMGAIEGWNSSLDCLTQYLESPRTQHQTFVLKRSLKVSPARAFAAWSTPAVKRRWFTEADGEDWVTVEFMMDFRVGGREHGRFEHRGTSVHVSEAVYLDIVQDERIVFAYTMSIDGTRISASLATVEFEPSAGGTQLIFTEQGAFFEGRDKPEIRKNGWSWLLDQMDAALDAS